MTNQNNYPIGKPGQKWGTQEKQQWFEQQTVKRSYQDEVLSKISALASEFDIEQYGALSIDEARYPLKVIKSKGFDSKKPTILITGGVHGYETSGVQGALAFVKNHGSHYSQYFNLVVAPCVSPWGYETINRWDPLALDPNRSFYHDSPAEESAAVMAMVDGIDGDILAHIDLHETTDTDNSEFRPALAARDAAVHDNWNIPDGFYLVGNSVSPQNAFQTAIITAVEKVTHIAPADENNQLIGVPLLQFGVINYAARDLGLCMGLTNAKYTTTTEVYPDSPKVDDENCNAAQVAVLCSALEYIITNELNNC